MITLEKCYFYAYYGDLDLFVNNCKIDDDTDFELLYCICNGLLLNFDFCLHMFRNHREVLCEDVIPKFNLLLSKPEYYKSLSSLNYFNLSFFNFDINFDNSIFEIESEIITELLSVNFLFKKDEANFNKIKLKKQVGICKYFIEKGYLPNYYSNKKLNLEVHHDENVCMMNLFSNAIYDYGKDDNLYTREYYAGYGEYDQEKTFHVHYLDILNLHNFLDNKEYYSRDYNNEEFKKEDILNNTSLAIYCYKNKIYLDYCLSRFITVSTRLNIEIPNFLYCKTLPRFAVLESRKEDNLYIYYHLLYYSIIYMYSTNIWNYRKFEYSFIEYNMYEGARKSCYELVFNEFLEKIEKGMPVYKYIDIENRRYLEEPIKIDVNSLSKKMEFDYTIYTL
ncbi:hypothetical protein KGF56_000164 [Candida oxycetoniae]|uniref:Uncharacterized protein n=1 Tax=Candida oxycetoniae TaxID=497107 RepID=A0AAI9T1T2_9ASCO|nr:uncharacterized protein KGF56_000164 [Candida oxycetoniae]KAI3406872.1 hypothetical protein KGF56_000164 [Candida oxycetoniae]